MNLRGIANSVTSSVNPNVSCNLLQSAGYVTQSDYSRTPQYSGQVIQVQVQALTFADLRQAEGINLQGTRRAVYVNGAVAGIIRVKKKGGDVLAFADGLLPEGNVWLVVHILEQWDSWAKFVITLQDDSVAPPIGGGSRLDFSDPNNSGNFPGLMGGI
jgi:hypothetical protein